MIAALWVAVALTLGIAGSVAVTRRPPARTEPRPLFWDEAMRELDVADGTRLPVMPEPSCAHDGHVHEVEVLAYGSRLVRVTRSCSRCGASVEAAS